MNYTDKLLIDGRDAYEEYGVFVSQYDYKQLIQFASFKSLDSTDWGDTNGLEVDLTAPKLDARTLQIQFYIVNKRFAEDLFYDLSNGAYHSFEFKELGKTYTLRMTQNGSFSSCVRLGKLQLTFADDFPVMPSETHYALGETEVRQSGFQIDGVDVSQFGAYVLKDTEAEIRKAAAVKDNLKVSSGSVSGVLYDGSVVNFKEKDVTLKCLIDAPSVTEFWKRYNAFFTALVQPEKRVFFYPALESEYDCYYSKMQVTKFEILRSGKVWCEFSVTLSLTDYRPISQWVLLATEDGAIVTTEEATPYSIIIRPR